MAHTTCIADDQEPESVTFQKKYQLHARSKQTVHLWKLGDISLLSFLNRSAHYCDGMLCLQLTEQRHLPEESLGTRASTSYLEQGTSLSCD